MNRLANRIVISLAALVLITIAGAIYITACPFCSAINMTFADQMKSNDIVVVAKLLEIPDPVDDPDAELPKARFEVTGVLKGNEFVAPGMEFRSLLVGRYPVGKNFLVMGVDPPDVAWSTPMKVTDRVIKYLNDIQKLPEKGADRLAFFQNYFEDKESVLAFDAYDEFAKAPYEDIIALKSRMPRELLRGWIKDTETSINRRRLYLTMLGVCGDKADIEMLEGFIKSGDRKKQAGLDALIGCYLTLKGESGLKLIEDTFLRDKEVEYVDTLAAVSALRFHGTETDKIDRDKIVRSIRILLDRPQMADMIIPDLARWEDWSVMERLVKMFKEADEETNWLRVPVISYLRACPEPKAKEYIEELRKIDPDAVKRADFFLDFTDDDDEDGWGDEDEDGQDTDNQDDPSADNPSVPVEGGKKTTANPGNDDAGQQFTSAPINREETYTVRKKPISKSSNPSELNSAAADAVTNSGAESFTESQGVANAAAPLTPVAQSGPTLATWKIVIFPMLISVAIFALLWSVINGWFERLIY